MSMLEKYKLDIKECILVKKLPTSSDVFLLELVNDKNDDLYINENGKLKLIASKPWSFSILLLFLKKYRKNPELLPKNLKHEFGKKSSKTIYNILLLMLTPVETYEQFENTIKKADKEILPLVLSDA